MIRMVPVRSEGKSTPQQREEHIHDTYPALTCIYRTTAAFKLIASLVFSAFTDLYLALYPATILFTLQMSWTKKLALSAALGVGSVYGVLPFKQSFPRQS